MNNISKLEEFLSSNDIIDILAGGYIEENNSHKKYQLDMMNVYFKSNDIFLRCSSIGQYDKIGIDTVNQITCDFPMDEDDEFCISSLQYLYLPDPGGRHKVTGFQALINRHGPGSVDIKCLELCFGATGKIFLDPTNLFGFKIYIGEWMDRFIEDNSHTLSGYELYTWARH